MTSDGGGAPPAPLDAATGTAAAADAAPMADRRPGGVRTTKRRGRLAPAARRALVEVAPRWALGEAAGEGTDAWTPTSLAEAFGRHAPRLLDIGTGHGEATRAWAMSHPGWDVVAVELHRPGLARLLRDLDSGGPANVRVAETDVVDVVSHRLHPASVQAVRALFPDPWPKRRHLTRRLFDDALVGRLADLLPVGGWLHVATDWEPYAEQIQWALSAESRFAPEPSGLAAAAAGGSSWQTARPPRPITPYEQRGLDAGRVITDLVAIRVAPSA